MVEELMKQKTQRDTPRLDPARHRSIIKVQRCGDEWDDSVRPQRPINVVNNGEAVHQRKDFLGA